MKLKIMKDEELDETYFIPSKLRPHWEKHVAPNWKIYIEDESEELLDPMTMEEYDDYGDELSKKIIKTSNLNSSDRYVGFVETTGEIVKYDKATNVLIIYTARPDFQATFSLYKTKDDDRYRRLIKKTYSREYTPEDDEYNR